jgi:4-amino-4-deoxy-L-arabinose transferase-like glycosyltransferase
MPDASYTNPKTTLNDFLNSLTPVVAVLLLFTATRLVLLTQLPIFLDEAIHIAWARDYGRPFIGIRHNKWLYPFLLSRLRPDGPEALWTARAISVLLGSLSCASCIALGRLLDARRTGLLAGLLYLVQPFAVFHDRQALVDPTMATAAALTIVFTVRLTRWQKAQDALFLGLSIAAAYLAKAAALPYFSLPLLAAIVLVSWRRLPWRYLLLAGSSVGLAYGIVRLTYARARQAGVNLHGLYTPSTSKLSYIADSLPDIVAKPGIALAAYWEILWVYFGLPIIIAIVLSLTLILIGKKRRALLFLWLPAIGFAALPVVAPRPTVFLPARYLASTSVPMAVLAALSTIALLRALWRSLPSGTTQQAKWLNLISAGVLVLLIGYSLPQDFTILTDPRNARLYSMDRWQYITGEVAGYGRSEAGEFLVQLWRDNDEERIGVVISGTSTDYIRAYMGPRVAIFRTWEELLRDPDEVAAWLAQGHSVYFIDESPDFRVPEKPYGAITEPVADYSLSTGSVLHISRVVGAEDSLREAIHSYQFIQPDDARVANEYPALAAALADDPSPRAIVAYPPNQIETLQTLLADYPHLTVYNVGDHWPFDSETTSLELVEIAEEHDLVEFVFLQETLGDPNRSIEGWLAGNLFWEAERWFGPLRLVSYQNTLDDLTFSPVGASFGEAITLKEIAVTNEVVAPGDSVRVALIWEPTGEVDHVYKVFAHLVSADEELLAQHDGLPAGGLSPTNTWNAETGPISDRFVISLPGDMPPGLYNLRAGFYDPETFARLPIQRLDDNLTGGPDYVTLGRVEVASDTN